MLTREQKAAQIEMLLVEHSKKAIAQARKAVVEEQIRDPMLREALRFFIEDFWFDAAHPTLLSLSCQAVGGNPDDTTKIAAAFVVLTGAADIHDDVIDQSLTKGPKETVYGKYGKELAIVAGNVLWIKGTLMLEEACESFPDDKKHAILEIAKEAFFNIGSAEAKEAIFKKNTDLRPEQYLDMLKLKVAVSEASTKIGVIIGNGRPDQLVMLREYGRSLGLLMTIRDEFIDMFEIDEIKNRLNNECVPLPILYAVKDVAIKQKLSSIFSQEKLTEDRLDEIIEIVYGASAVRKLVKDMQALVEELTTKFCGSVESERMLISLLRFSLEDLPIEN